MNAPKTRGQAINAMCRSCIYDESAEGSAVAQTTACSSTDCPLWRFRPLSRTAPACFQSRDPANLPEGFDKLSHAEAIRAVRGEVDASPRGDAVQAPSETRTTDPIPTQRVGGDGSVCGSFEGAPK